MSLKKLLIKKHVTLSAIVLACGDVCFGMASMRSAMYTCL